MPPFTAAPTICVAPLFPVLYVIMKVGRSHEEVNQFSQQERAHSCRLQGVVHDCFQGTKYDDLARFRRILSPLYRSRTVKSISRLFDSVPVRRFLCSSHVGVQNKTQRHHSSWLFTAMKLPCDRPIARVHSQEPKTTLFVLSLTRFALPKMVPEIFLFLIERGDEKHNSVTSSRFSQSSSTLPIPAPTRPEQASLQHSIAGREKHAASPALLLKPQQGRYQYHQKISNSGFKQRDS